MRKAFLCDIYQMNSDPRVEFIINQIKAAALEVKPDAPVEILGEDEKQVRDAVSFGLKVFDRLLPQVVKHVIEVRKNLPA